MSNSRRLPNFIKYKFYNCTFHRAQKWRKIDQIKQIGRIFFRKSKILKTIQGKYRTCSSVLLMEHGTDGLLHFGSQTLVELHAK